jgi:uncharacterized protein (TIGR02646 family)
MKCVAKRMSPQSFEDWKLLANSEWQPRYSNLQTPQKQALHEALLSEQGWVCCYCGRPVGLRDSHIEHFHPQERHVDLALSYDNLHASCIREAAPGIPLHCVMPKENISTRHFASPHWIHVARKDSSTHWMVRFKPGLSSTVAPAT